MHRKTLHPQRLQARGVLSDVSGYAGIEEVGNYAGATASTSSGKDSNSSEAALAASSEAELATYYNYARSAAYKNFQYSIVTDSETSKKAVSIIGYTGKAKKITIPSKIKGYKVIEIAFGAFSGCESLTSVTIPSTVRQIGGSAFDSCTNLTSVTIPSSVTTIDYYTFYGCTSLKSVSIPSSVTEIGFYAFYGCSSLKKVTLPKNCKSIGESAFDGCALTSIKLPSPASTALSIRKTRRRSLPVRAERRQ